MVSIGWEKLAVKECLFMRFGHHLSVELSWCAGDLGSEIRLHIEQLLHCGFQLLTGAKLL
jgi:hypothetical protein